MQWRILITIVSSLLVAAAVGGTLYATTESKSQAESGPSSSHRAGLPLGEADGLSEARADAFTDTLRARRTASIEAGALLAKLCARMAPQLPWVHQIHVYAPDSPPLADSTSAPELGGACR